MHYWNLKTILSILVDCMNSLPDWFRFCILLGFFSPFPHDLLRIKLEPWEGSVAASSHVFTRACNMNGALSGCRKGGKVHLTGPNLNGGIDWFVVGPDRTHLENVLTFDLNFTSTVRKRDNFMPHLRRLCKDAFIIHWRDKQLRNSLFWHSSSL